MHYDEDVARWFDGKPWVVKVNQNLSMFLKKDLRVKTNQEMERSLSIYVVDDSEKYELLSLKKLLTTSSSALGF